VGEVQVEIKFIENGKYNHTSTVVYFLTVENIASLTKITMFQDVNIQEILQNYDFNAKKTQVLKLSAFKGLKHLIFVGLGNKESLNRKVALNCGGTLGDYINKEASIYMQVLGESNNSNIIDDITTGIRLKLWNFNKYLSNKNEEKTLETIHIINAKIDTNESNALVNGVTFARDLISEPANVLYPSSYVERIKELTKLGVEVEILDKKALTALKMDSFLSVSLGSDKEPYVAILKYNGKQDSSQPLAIVGKGVTYDSGGYSLKPGMGMMTMKSDMSGSATTVGLIKTLAERKAKVNVVGVVGLVENLVNGSAIKPGDIISSMSGKTIEVLNTDAEGRLVLADLLWYTQTVIKPSAMINLATLTGAIVVCLGGERAGLFSNNQDLANQLMQAGEYSGELLWQLPLTEEYEKPLKSTIADLQNISTANRVPGSIFAAMFLKEFVGDVKWAHLDIAGMALTLENTPTAKRGAVGFGVRLLNDFIKLNYEK
jgi:leucyl aminopeptidase